MIITVLTCKVNDIYLRLASLPPLSSAMRRLRLKKEGLMSWDLEIETQHLFVLILLLNMILYTYYVPNIMLQDGNLKKKNLLFNLSVLHHCAVAGQNPHLFYGGENCLRVSWRIVRTGIAQACPLHSSFLSYIKK